jgi:RNase P/RNase MRP subunit POP5
MIREKRRYILVEASEPIGGGGATQGAGDFEKDLYAALRSELGGIHYFSANPRIALYIGDRAFIVKCSLRCFPDMILALAMIKRLGNRDIGLYTLKSSGTMRALKAFQTFGGNDGKRL